MLLQNLSLMSNVLLHKKKREEYLKTRIYRYAFNK